MKKFFYFIILILTLTACYRNSPDDVIKPINTNNQIQIRGRHFYIYTLKYKNHTYIAVNGFYTFMLEHDPDCQCYKTISN